MYGFVDTPYRLKKIDQKDWFYYPEFWANEMFDFNLLQDYADNKYMSREEAYLDFIKNSDIKINIQTTNMAIKEILQQLEKKFGFGEKKYYCEQFVDNLLITHIDQ